MSTKPSSKTLGCNLATVMKTLLFVPGYRENNNSRDYESVLDLFRDAGCDVHFVNIDWKRTTVNEWVSQLLAVYDQIDGDVVLAGFSFGAVTALVAASQRPASEIWLFSLSPFFSEDLSHLKSWETKQLGKRRVAAAANTSFRSVSGVVHCPVKLFVGSREIARWPEMKARFNEASCAFSDVTPIVVEGVGHRVDHKLYAAAIARAIEN